MADLVITPVEEGAISKACNTVTSTTLQLMNHKRVSTFIEKIRNVRAHSEVLEMAGSVDTKGSFEIVSAAIYLFEDFATLLSVCDDKRHFFAGCSVNNVKVFKRPSKSCGSK